MIPKGGVCILENVYMLPIFWLLVWYSTDWLSGRPNQYWSNSILGFLFPTFGGTWQPNQLIGFGGFARFLGDLPSPNLHSHIHTFAATHNCFLLEVFEGLVTPD